MSTPNFQSLANFIWSVADLLRGPYRPPQYERVMLPMTVLRRFDCVLELTKDKVLAKHTQLEASGKVKNPDATLNAIAKDKDGRSLGFHNHSPLSFQKLKGDPDNIGRHLQDYINGFSANIRRIFEYFEFDKEIEKMEEANRLYLVVSKFAEIDLHPDVVDNIAMGLVFEDLIRRFNEAANETAGDHFTPREVIRLMVNLLMEPDGDILAGGSPIVTVCDPACGTGGMLAEAQNWIRTHNEAAIVKVFGQDYNPRSYAVAASDLLIKGHKDSRIEFGNTLTDARFDDIDGFDYLLANPPFGVDWKAEQKEIKKWKDFYGYQGKLPPVNDGALLFLLYMLSKRQDFRPSPDPQKNKRGTRIAIVFNGSPLFTGGAGSGESDIRRWIIEHDWLEAIVALPEQMFYNTGIGTFVWVVTNRKDKKRRGKIQLIDSRDRRKPMKRSLGDKRRFLDADTIDTLTREHGAFEASDTCKLFDNADFGYRRITVERPLRLRFQITDDAKANFLNVCPELFDAVEAIENALGTEPYLDWNAVWIDVQRIVKGCDISWTAGVAGTAQKKIFRDCFTETDLDAEPVIARRVNLSGVVSDDDFPGQQFPSDLETDALDALFGVYSETKGRKSKAIQYEADPKLRDNENVPLKEDIVSFFLREVRPYVADAWINPDAKLRDEKDGGIGKVGYEINFNRVFFKYEPPRDLKVIDAELAEVEVRIVEMLQEVTECTALVSRAVARGLDPDVPLKPSGLDWLGDIPEHWEVPRLKHIAEVRGGLTLGKNYEKKDLREWPYLRVANVQDGNLDLSKIATVMVPDSVAENYLLRKGDVLMNEGGDEDKLGRGAVWNSQIEPCLHQNHVFCVRPSHQITSDWLNAWTSSAFAKYYFQLRAKRSTNLASISATSVGGLPTLVPPIKEQIAIVKHIDSEHLRLNRLTEEFSRSINLLKERRSALITAAVTGQIPLEEMDTDHEGSLTESFIRDDIQWGLYGRD